MIHNTCNLAADKVRLHDIHWMQATTLLRLLTNEKSNETFCDIMHLILFWSHFQSYAYFCCCWRSHDLAFTKRSHDCVTNHVNRDVLWPSESNAILEAVPHHVTNRITFSLRAVILCCYCSSLMEFPNSLCFSTWELRSLPKNWTYGPTLMSWRYHTTIYIQPFACSKSFKLSFLN